MPLLLAVVAAHLAGAAAAAGPAGAGPPRLAPPPQASTILHVDAGQFVGLRSPMTVPGAVMQGGILWHRPDNWTLHDWFVEHGVRDGAYRITVRLHELEDQALTLDALQSSVLAAHQYGRTVLVKIIGTPRSMTSLPDTIPPGIFERNYWKFPPADSLWPLWRERISNLVTLLSIPGATVTDSTLFGDAEPHPSLGLAGLAYEIWNEQNGTGSWMPDLFGLGAQGSEEKFFELYAQSAAAIDSTVAAHPGTEVATLGVSFRLASNGAHAWGYPAGDALRRFAGFCARNGLPLGRVSSWVYDYEPESVSGDLRNPHGTWQEEFRAALDDSGLSATKLNVGEWSMHFASNLLLPPAGEPGMLTQCEIEENQERCNVNDDNEVGAAFAVVRMMDLRREVLDGYGGGALQLDDASYFDFVEGSPTDAGSVFPLYKYDSALYTTCGLHKALTNVFFMMARLAADEVSTELEIIEVPPGTELGDFRVGGYGTATRGETIAVLAWYYFDFFGRLQPGAAWADSIGYDTVRAMADTLPAVAMQLDLRNIASYLGSGDSLAVHEYMVDRTHGNSWEYRNAIAAAVAAYGSFEARREFLRQTVNHWSFAQGDTVSVALEEVAGATVPWSNELTWDLVLAPFSVALLEIAPGAVTSVADAGAGVAPARTSLRFTPNPFRAAATLLATGVPPGLAATPGRSPPPAARIFDVQGRMVRILRLEPPGAGSGGAAARAGTLRAAWDGRDGRGRRLPAGIYFAVPSWRDGPVARVVLLR